MSKDMNKHNSGDDWQAPHERGEFTVRDERAPLGRWLVGIILLGLVIAGAIWLASQAEIDAYDNRAWATAEGRNTIAGYEDYIAAWPEGRHASKAQERIDEMKAAAEAARKDAAEREEAARREAAERARREARDWQTAAQTNTVQSYQDYLTKHSAGPNAPEAQARIDRMQASAAETAAWNAAKAANTASAYQAYLSSYPQGIYAAQAIAALEKLRPSPGRTFRDCAACPDMVSLPSGTASLGAGDNEANARPNEKPQRPVTFANMFAVSVTEVSFAQYDACISAGGCSGRPSDNGWGRGNRPVINVCYLAVHRPRYAPLQMAQGQKAGLNGRTQLAPILLRTAPCRRAGWERINSALKMRLVMSLNGRRTVIHSTCATRPQMVARIAAAHVISVLCAAGHGSLALLIYAMQRA